MIVTTQPPLFHQWFRNTNSSPVGFSDCYYYEVLISGISQHMSAGKWAFKPREVKRLVGAAVAAGYPPERLKLSYDLKNSKISVEVVPEGQKIDEIEPVKTPNPWDELL